jgi:hypothetical protein
MTVLEHIKQLSEARWLSNLSYRRVARQGGESCHASNEHLTKEFDAKGI